MPKKAIEKKKEEKKKTSPKKKVFSKEKVIKPVVKLAEEKALEVKENVKEVKTDTKEEVKEEVREKKQRPFKKDFISGTGRRKTAVARIFLWQNKGDFTVNSMKVEEYFSEGVDKSKWARPFHAVGISHPEAKFSGTIKVQGSGKSSQLDAVVLAISKALSKIDAEFDKILRKQGFMTRDSRMVERKKPFLRKARKRPQYSKR